MRNILLSLVLVCFVVSVSAQRGQISDEYALEPTDMWLDVDDFEFLEADADMFETDGRGEWNPFSSSSSDSSQQRSATRRRTSFFRSIGNAIRKTTSSIRRAVRRIISHRRPVSNRTTAYRTRYAARRSYRTRATARRTYARRATTYRTRATARRTYARRATTYRTRATARRTVVRNSVARAPTVRSAVVRALTSSGSAASSSSATTAVRAASSTSSGSAASSSSATTAVRAASSTSSGSAASSSSATTAVRAASSSSSGSGGSGCLPSLSSASRCFVQGKLDAVKKALGGGADASYITNSCAMKMSHLMNCNAAAVNKPQCAIKTQSGLVTVPGKSGERLALRVRELLPVLLKLLGTPTMSVRAQSRGVDYAQFKGKAGIVVFDTTGAWDDATGHMSVLMGNDRLIENHIPAADVQRYFALSVQVTFWQM